MGRTTAGWNMSLSRRGSNKPVVSGRSSSQRRPEVGDNRIRILTAYYAEDGERNRDGDKMTCTSAWG